MAPEALQMESELLDYLKKQDHAYTMDMISKAFETAARLHEGQFRRSGDPYIIHPYETAKILIDLGMDDETVIAGLLHDVVEDTEYTEEELSSDFSPEVALLVDGVTKLGSLKFESREEAQAENIRKMFLAMSEDIRVLIIKLADRLHNLRTIDFMPPHKIEEKCRETLEIYAPLANRLGMFNMKFELEDIALKHLKPAFYADLSRQINQRKEQREEDIRKIIEKLKIELDKSGLNYEVYGRSKHFYSIYKKMHDKHKQLDEIFDLLAIRVLVDSIKDCYQVLGIVHTLWPPVPGRFKDYIARPKSNMYQSLHTTVFGDDNKPFEIQIRTYEMHRTAEYGIAAHWKYKEGVERENDEEKLAWLRQSLELNKDSENSEEFLEAVKTELFSNQVFVFTPAGKVIELPAGSTPLDFAYKIHSNVGNQCVGAKVNQRMVTLDHRLANGDIVEIITSANSRGPTIDWLKIAKSKNAKNKIRQWLRKENKSENVEKGRMMLEKFVARKRYDPDQLLNAARVHKVAKDLNFPSADDLYSSIGYGGTLLSKVLELLLKQFEIEKATEARQREKEFRNKESKLVRTTGSVDNVRVKGVDHLLTRLAQCCSPVPGDDIVGYISKGKGVTVHWTGCPNLKRLCEEDSGRMVEVEWSSEIPINKQFRADLTVIGEDRLGMFADISKVCADMDVHIANINGHINNDNTAQLDIAILITNINQIKRIVGRLRSMKGVYEIRRGRAGYSQRI